MPKNIPEIYMEIGEGKGAFIKLSFENWKNIIRSLKNLSISPF